MGLLICCGGRIRQRMCHWAFVWSCNSAAKLRRIKSGDKSGLQSYCHIYLYIYMQLRMLRTITLLPNWRKHVPCDHVQKYCTPFKNTYCLRTVFVSRSYNDYKHVKKITVLSVYVTVLYDVVVFKHMLQAMHTIGV